jgi:hypothetical protein
MTNTMMYGALIKHSGIHLEQDLEQFLDQHHIRYLRGVDQKMEIDFTIYDVHMNKIYVECKNQQSQGSVVDKIPHTIWKYHRKYQMQQLFLLVGALHVIPDYIHENIQWLEQVLHLQVHVVTLDIMKQHLVSQLSDYQYISPLNGL